MQNILTNLLAVGFSLGIIIVVHEAGHLLMAKTFGVRVLTFSIGFGKRLIGIQRGETDYRIAAIPLGGYVRLDGENPEEQSGDPRQFLSKPRWQRVLVFLAGPAMNIVLSTTIFAVLFMLGMSIPTLPNVAPVVGAVDEGSPAAHAGLAPGDRIVKVNGEVARNWQQVELALVTSPDKPVPLTVQRGGRSLAVTVIPKRVPRYEVGDPGFGPETRPEILDVFGKPALAAGLRSGDEVRAVDGRPVTDSQDFSDTISKHPGQHLAVTVARQGKLVVLDVVPALDGKAVRIGVSLGFRLPPGQALVASLQLNAQIVSDTFQVLGKVFRREMSAKGALSGPIEIASVTGAAARTSTKSLFYVMGLISISIAILNLMPIPILDGGQIFILLIEEIIRHDLPLRFKEVMSQVGLVIILMLMMVVIYFDLSKNLGSFLPGS